MHIYIYNFKEAIPLDTYMKSTETSCILLGSSPCWKMTI